MSVSDIFSSMKKESLVLGPLDRYLIDLESVDSDRAVNVNSPSAIGSCLRSQYYSRKGYPRQGNSPRSKRILDNGTHVHLRLQEYLLNAGILLMDEVPVVDPEYNIQGHTDGILKSGDYPNGNYELIVLEIKSANSRTFAGLKDALDKHKHQAIIYAHCLEKRRKYLRDKYPSYTSFLKDLPNRVAFYRSRYEHLKDGHKYTREEKILYQVELHKKVDTLLYKCKNPITKVDFLYECKDTQDIKEYEVSVHDRNGRSVLQDALSDCQYLNECCESDTLPDREGKSRSCELCKYCNYKVECWN